MRKFDVIRKDQGILMLGSFLSAQFGSKGGSEELAEMFDLQGKHIILASSQPKRAFRLVDMLWRIWTRKDEYSLAFVDVFSGFAFVWAEVVSYFLRILKKPYILILRGGGLVTFANRWPGRVRHLLANAKIVTTPSFYLEDGLKQFRKDIICLRNGLDLKHYIFKLRANPSPNLCWLRAFHEIYNPSLAIQVVKRLRKTFPDIKLTMIGPDKADGSLEQVLKLIKEGNLEKHVDIVGAVAKKNVPSWLQKYDVYLNTTSLESFGVAVMEAGAVGLPIVTTNVGELPYLWSNGEDALLVPPNDADAMAKAVQRILTEPGLAERLSRNARRKVEKFDWSVIMPQWERLVEQVRSTK